LEENTYVHLVVHNKSGAAANQAEFQIHGEMLAAAYRNYTILKASQTIYAMRMTGLSTSIYRADFPVKYLESVERENHPTHKITVFKVGGTSANTSLNNKVGRSLAVQLICSAMDSCLYLSKELRNASLKQQVKGASVEPPMTSERLKWLEANGNQSRKAHYSDFYTYRKDCKF